MLKIFRWERQKAIKVIEAWDRKVFNDLIILETFIGFGTTYGHNAGNFVSIYYLQDLQLRILENYRY